jgi:hypothetical protein
MRQSHGHGQADEQQFMADASWFALALRGIFPIQPRLKGVEDGSFQEE